MALLSKPVAAVALSAAMAAACTGSDQPGQPAGTLVQRANATPAPIDVDRAGRHAAELVRAALMPHRAMAAGLGAHRIRATSAVQVTEDGAAVESLEVTTTVDHEADGDFHAVLENSADYGRQVYFAGGYLYLAPRYGDTFHRRLPQSQDEPARILDELVAELGAYTELVQDGIEVADKGVERYQGRPVRKIEVKLAPRPRPPSKQTLPQRGWRASVVVTQASGELLLDQTTGAPLSGHIDAAVTMRRDGRTFTMNVSATRVVEDLGEAVVVTAPPQDQWISTPERQREADQRELLLRGIAPPARRQSAPAEPAATPAPAPTPPQSASSSGNG